MTEYEARANLEPGAQMTTADALTVLRLSASDDYSGMTVRYADQMGDDADLAECEEAAKVLGLTLIEDEDGALVVE